MDADFFIMLLSYSNHSNQRKSASNIFLKKKIPIEPNYLQTATFQEKSILAFYGLTYKKSYTIKSSSVL